MIFQVIRSSFGNVPRVGLEIRPTSMYPVIGLLRYVFYNSHHPRIQKVRTLRADAVDVSVNGFGDVTLLEVESNTIVRRILWRPIFCRGVTLYIHIRNTPYVRTAGKRP